MTDDGHPPKKITGGKTGDATATSSLGPGASIPSSSLMLRIAEGYEDPRFRDLATSVVAPSTRIMHAQTGLVTIAGRLRQASPHIYLPLLASLKLPVPRLFVIYEREGIEHGILAERRTGGVLTLKHVRASADGALEQPSASSLLDLDTPRPPVLDNASSCGQSAEADRAWLSWFHTMASPMAAGIGTITEHQGRQWFQWLVDDLAVLAVAFSGAAVSQTAKFDSDFRIRPVEQPHG